MIFFNDIINGGGTPSIQENILANRPAANTSGRLFIQTDSPYNIYRDTGTAWQQISGSGGSGVSQIIAGTNVTISPTGGTGAVTINATGGGGSWADSLESGYFGNYKSYNYNNFGIQFENVEYNNYFFAATSNSFLINQYFIGFFDNTLEDFNVFYFEYNSNPLVKLGDFNAAYNNCKFYLNDNDNVIVATIGNYTSGTYTTNNYGLVMSGYNISLGSYAGSGNSTGIKIDDKNAILSLFSGFTNTDSPFYRITEYYTQIGDYNGNYSEFLFTINRELSVLETTVFGYVFGIQINTSSGVVKLGDIGELYGIAYIDINSINEEIIFNSSAAQSFITNSVYFNVGTDFTIEVGSGFALESTNEIGLTTNYLYLNYNFLQVNGTGITQTSSGATSSVHLKIRINGTDYVIQLRNP